ncbi:hypothetical protein KR222_011863, partial [Zaprionus bogoriensis]
MQERKTYSVTDSTGDALRASTFAQHVYTKRVRNPEDLSTWKRSQAYYDLVAYINNTSMVIQGYRQESGYPITPQMLKLCKIFNWLDRLLYEFHPMGVGQGLLLCVGEGRVELMESTESLSQKCHRAYRRWMMQVEQKVYSILEQQVRPHCKHINELAQYLTRSLGSLRNFEYGPGNELMFLFYLCALFKIGILDSEDTVAAALLLYQRYLDLVRRIILFYRLAPQQSQDEHIIDERNVLPYLWGSAQLCLDAPFAPPQWNQPQVMTDHRKNYMLLSSLQFLQKTKEGRSLGVHSYQLWCILSLSNWPDAYSGLMRTYLKSILNDFYITQDLIFSEIMTFVSQPSELLPRAYLGKRRQPDSSDSSIRSSDEPSRTSQNDRALRSNRPSKVRYLVEGGEVLQPPVPRHSNPEPNVFLGFQNPRKSDPESEKPFER